MDWAAMSTLEMIGLGFLLWIGLIIFITITCILYMKSPRIKREVARQRRIWFPSDEENEAFDSDWMDYKSWKETQP